MDPILSPTTLPHDPVLNHWAAPYTTPGAQWFTVTYNTEDPNYAPGIFTLVIYPNGKARGFEYDTCMFGLLPLTTAIQELTFNL